MRGLGEIVAMNKRTGTNSVPIKTTEQGRPICRKCDKVVNPILEPFAKGHEPLKGNK